MSRNITVGLTDAQVLELVHDSALGGGASKSVHQHLVRAKYTASEIRGVYSMMNWLFTTSGLSWDSMVDHFQTLIPSRTGADLAALVKAIGKDMPGTPLLQLLPRQ